MMMKMPPAMIASTRNEPTDWRGLDSRLERHPVGWRARSRICRYGKPTRSGLRRRGSGMGKVCHIARCCRSARRPPGNDVVSAPGLTPEVSCHRACGGRWIGRSVREGDVMRSVWLVAGSIGLLVSAYVADRSRRQRRLPARRSPRTPRRPEMGSTARVRALPDQNRPCAAHVGDAGYDREHGGAHHRPEADLADDGKGVATAA